MPLPTTGGARPSPPKPLPKAAYTRPSSTIQYVQKEGGHREEKEGEDHGGIIVDLFEESHRAPRWERDFGLLSYAETIIDYENNVFFDILAEDLARRDMDDVPIDESNYQELASRIEAYIAE